MSVLAIMIFVMWIAPLASAQKAHCTQAQIDKLEIRSDHLRSWQQLHIFFRRYSDCNIDDAEVEEGVSESVARLLVDHWTTLPEGWALMRNAPSFHKFVLGGINETLLVKDLDAISINARERCPHNLQSICIEIKRAADFVPPS